MQINMLRFLSIGFVLGAVFGCTEVVRTCSNCYVDDSVCSPSQTSFNTARLTCLGYLNSPGVIFVTWTQAYSNYCQRFTCYPGFSVSALNSVTFTKSCNAACTNVTVAKYDSMRISAAEPTVNVTSMTSLDQCYNMCVEIAYSGKKCTVSYSSGSCKLYADSTCTGGSCDTQSASGNTVLVVQCDFTVCPILANPANGYVNMSGTVVGSTATYSCDVGYGETQVQTVICLSDGTWTSWSSSCQAVNCSNPNAPVSGSVSAPVTTYLATATYSCNTGYILSGQSSRICQANGTWGGNLASCNPINCGTPSSLVNGSFSAPVTTYQATATYSCNSGYILSGQSSTTCQANGTWSGTLATCNPINCGTPSSPINGSVSAPLTSYQATATYFCNSGYILSGQSSRICQANGTWGGTLPTCNPINCGTPSSLINGSVSAPLTTYLATATYSCNSGYILSGQSSTICQANGTWSGTLPTCNSINCGTPSSPINGSFSAPVTTYQATATYSCNSGYSLSGQSSRICQANGSWSGILPTCNPINCGTPISPINGSFSASVTTYLATATYSCNSGYILSGQSSTICQANGTWSGNLPTCNPVNCGTPSSPINGNFSAPVTTYLATAIYSCNSGFILSGQSSTICQANGTWSGNLPTCNPINCGTPSSPINGSFSALMTTYQATATYSCNLGYLLFGSNSSICQANGIWSGALPTCNPVDCGTPPVPSNCTTTASETTYLQSVVYTCDFGHVLIGGPNRTCQANMTWSEITPTCQIVDCGQPHTPTNGSAQATITTYSHHALYECNFGYRLEGQNTTVCLSNGSWSGNLPSCKVINCMMPTPPQNGSVNSTGTSYMARTDYFCDTGYNLTGLSVRFCQNDDTWNGTDPRCDPVDCRNRTAPMNGSVGVVDTTYLNSAVYQCDSGFLLNGPNTSVCQANGSWNVDVPVCDPVDCGNLTDPVNGIVSVMGTTYTSVAFYQCNFGYRLDGENMTECLSNSSWSYAKPNCKMIGCGPLSNPENGFVFMPNGTDVGANATYSCKPGYKLSHQLVRNCVVNNQWTGKEPTCDVRIYKKLYILPCICYPNKTFAGMTTEEILLKLETDTAIDPKDTGSARRMLESAYDPRVSSKILGVLGISVLVFVFGLLICVDFVNVYIHFVEKKKKK